MDKLVVVFVQDFAADDRVVFGLLGKGAAQPPELERKDGADEDGRSDHDAWAWVERCHGQVHVVENDVERAEEAE